jgi:hypothetical protein
MHAYYASSTAAVAAVHWTSLVVSSASLQFLLYMSAACLQVRPEQKDGWAMQLLPITLVQVLADGGCSSCVNMLQHWKRCQTARHIHVSWQERTLFADI